MVFVCWQWKGAKIPLMPGIPTNQPVLQVQSDAFIFSPHIQKPSGGWRHYNSLYQWLPYGRTSLLSPNILPDSIRLQRSEEWSHDFTNRASAE